MPYCDHWKAAIPYPPLLPWSVLNKSPGPRLNHSCSSTATHCYTCNETHHTVLCHSKATFTS
ncbi:hypothetical protein FUT69_03600 [Xylella taiwanensis]|nr:hypothetical protein [Xylella taiwanensis]